MPESLCMHPSDLFRKRVAQAIEQEVAEQEQRDRSGAEGKQPLPVAGRSPGGRRVGRKKQDLLVSDREMRERVQIRNGRIRSGALNQA